MQVDIKYRTGQDVRWFHSRDVLPQGKTRSSKSDTDVQSFSGMDAAGSTPCEFFAQAKTLEAEKCTRMYIFQRVTKVLFW